MKIWKTSEVCEVYSTQSHGWATGALGHTSCRFHLDLSAKSTLSQLHCHWKHVLGISVWSWNNTSNHGVENRITTNTQKIFPWKSWGWNGCWPSPFLIIRVNQKYIQPEEKTVNSVKYTCRCWKRYSGMAAGSFCKTFLLPIPPWQWSISMWIMAWWRLATNQTKLSLFQPTFFDSIQWKPPSKKDPRSIRTSRR